MEELTRKRALILIMLLMIASLPLITVLSSFRIALFNRSFYKAEFEKNKVYDKIPEADSYLGELFLFFKGKEKLDIGIFSENEKMHMNDVKILVNNAIIFNYSLILVFVVLLLILVRLSENTLKNLGFVFLFGGALTIILFLFFAMAPFTGLFTNFHLIFFQQGNWLFPADSPIITLFPFGFFYDISLKIFINSLIASVALIIAGILLSKASKK